jgi:hypothetical protein
MFQALGASPAEDHWGVRDAAARLIATLIAKFGAPYPDMQPRISRQLLRAFLDPAKPLTTHYGEFAAPHAPLVPFSLYNAHACIACLCISAAAAR